ncbi:unnamed protein product [Cylindrotheca closterium]|uniref:Uncharacterized protein n=1 Tax=Cylindrotheca closterium TaxID=2856 RepID=A0AAD2JJG1_9STRA|nr:unnamed protein product [Cylindrotheca closterium]
MSAFASGRAALRLSRNRASTSHWQSLYQSTHTVATRGLIASHNIRPYGALCQPPPSWSSPASRIFSTYDGSSMTPAQLQQLVLKHSLQDDPMEAHTILNQLFMMDSKEVTPEIQTAVMDSWIVYQSKCQQQLNESISSGSNESNLSEVHRNVHEMGKAAEHASQILESMDSPSRHHIVAVLKALANVSEASHTTSVFKGDFVRGIPQRAQHFWQIHENLPIEASNQLLRAWAYSKEYLRGTMAEQIFQQIEHPNGESYKNIIRAWCWSKERRCAFTATGHLMRMMRLLETGKSDMEPSLDDYHVLFHAWTTAEDKNAPSKACSVIQIISGAHKRGHTELAPDETCYRDTLTTISRRVNVPEVGELADNMLKEMKEAMFIPDSECYSAAIQAWNHVATARESEDREGAVQRALDLLQEMTKAYHRTTTVTIRPTVKDYNNVLEALTISKNTKATRHAETLLTALEEADTSAVDGLKPNAESYKFTFDVWKNSKSPNKVPRSLNILRRMTDRAEFSTDADQTYVPAFSSFIDVCANCGSTENSRKTMTLVLRIFDEMRSNGLQPDSSTYAALLEACNNLIQDGQERQKVLKRVFVKACDDGYVNQTVLEQFKKSASTYSFANVVISHSREVEGMKVVPESWTRNIQGFQVKTKGGKQVLPLSIGGQFTFTKAAAEYKMRKLRQRHNQRLLQGGRTK